MQSVRGVRVVIVGSLNMDLIVNVPHLPRPGETVIGDSLLRAPGGKGANQAVAAARLGASVTMIGRVGHDSFGRDLTRGLRDEGVSTRWVRGSERPTGAALIQVDENGENTIAVAPGANAELLPEDIPRKAIEAANVVVAPLEVPLASIEESFRLARQVGVRTMLNAAPAQVVPRSLLDLSNVVICNQVELGMLLGRRVAAGDEAVAARALRSVPDQVVVVTLGERGALAVTGSDVIEQPAYRVQIVDSTGAGDAFVAGFSIALQAADVSAALRLGCAAGAVAVTRRGAQPSMPSLAEVAPLIGT
ncbi:MAG: ribokinase [Chloroflexota bacterium]|nr:ribokinase [Chloroflexota bacterium]